MRHLRSACAASLLLAGILPPGLATADPWPACRAFWRLEDLPKLQAGVVAGPANHVHFVNSAQEGCPSAAAACLSMHFVVPGDGIAVLGTGKDFVCDLRGSPRHPDLGSAACGKRPDSQRCRRHATRSCWKMETAFQFHHHCGRR